MKFEILASKVAEEFRETMSQEGFDSFNEMAKCYWWSAEDIKEEVDEIIRSIDDTACIDEVDGKSVILDGDEISYRKFAAMWRKAI